MPRHYQEVEVLLKKLEVSLKNAHLWKVERPSKQALSSQLPFAYDTMPLESWLQFIFIPKIQTMISSNSPLPNQLTLLPIAEMQFSHSRPYQPVLDVIKQIDELFNV